MTEQTVHFDNAREMHDILGPTAERLPLIGRAFKVRQTARDLWVRITGGADGVATAVRFYETLRRGRSRGVALREQDLHLALEAFRSGRDDLLEKMYSSRIGVGAGRNPVFPRTLGQQQYLEAIRAQDIVFGIGPAGTGKTYLAMAMAVAELMAGEVSRIILTRPAVEAGEALGFLPGTLQEKIQPYLRPLHDALYDMMSPEEIEQHMERGVIEVAPLAYMRGRTLNHAFVILDEAQNTSEEQMLMFLTRLGFDSKCVITGDLTQIDLPPRKSSGLIEACHTLARVPGIAIVELGDSDVVRHELVQKIIQAYRRTRNTPQGSASPILETPDPA
jgi:phosphate starvation-inducible PhoH-like protein